MFSFVSGHEYSLANLEFAAQLEPNNATVQEKFRHFAQLRKSRRPTVSLSEPLSSWVFLFLDCDMGKLDSSILWKVLGFLRFV